MIVIVIVESWSIVVCLFTVVLVRVCIRWGNLEKEREREMCVCRKTADE